MAEEKQKSSEDKANEEKIHSGDFDELGSLDPNVDQNLMRLSGTN